MKPGDLVQFTYDEVTPRIGLVTRQEPRWGKDTYYVLCFGKEHLFSQHMLSKVENECHRKNP